MCRKDKETFKCDGCLQQFCQTYADAHRELLCEQLDEVEVTCGRLGQTVTDQKSSPEKRTLIYEINEWERQPIEKFRRSTLSRLAD